MLNNMLGGDLMADIKKLGHESHKGWGTLTKVRSALWRRNLRRAASLLPLLALAQPAHAQLVSTSNVSSGMFFIAFASLLMAGIAANAFLVSLVRPATERGGWQQKWEFTP